jgi:hypothetical protein
MTTPRNPRGQAGRPGSLEWDNLESGARTARMLAVAALVLAVLAVGLAAWQLISTPGTCQEEAWAVEPDTANLPADWDLGAAQYDLGQKNLSYFGAVDDIGSQPQVLVTVTCFPTGAEESVTRSREAAEDAGMSVIEREDMGEQSYSAVSPTGATFVQVRTGRLVAYLAGTTDTAPTDVEQIASAFDIAMGGDGSNTDVPLPQPSQDVGQVSPDPGVSQPPASQTVPELAAVLPTQVGDMQIEIVSSTGEQFLGEDAGSRAVLAALRDAGLEAGDLKTAEGYDSLAETDLSMLAVTIDGMAGKDMRDMVLNIWLAATGTGVERTTTTLGGEEWMVIDYGDEGRKDYVLLRGDTLIDISTSDPSLAEQVAVALP